MEYLTEMNRIRAIVHLRYDNVKDQSIVSTASTHY